MFGTQFLVQLINHVVALRNTIGWLGAMRKRQVILASILSRALRARDLIFATIKFMVFKPRRAISLLLRLALLEQVIHHYLPISPGSPFQFKVDHCRRSLVHYLNRCSTLW